ncbi:hypothetical protein ACH5RR_005956 [Cinchona calisaya]|uniref:Uncharacterized protein n=1 Tax=Cinchona calisaya TaxID=153742 RepID=A0ABD3AMM2_9GENT
MDIKNWRKLGSTRKNIYLGRHYDYQGLQESVKLPAAHDNCNAGSKKQIMTWKTLLRKLSKEKGKLCFEPSKLVKKAPYDKKSYMQNFDDGQIIDDDEVDNDILSRSFSVRFADPSKLFLEKELLGM